MDILAAAASVPEILGELATGGDSEAALARHYSRQGQSDRAATARQKARELYQRQVVDDPTDVAAATALTELLLMEDQVNWTTLEPASAKSMEGASLSVRPDGSILVGGANPDQDTYELKCVADLKAITVFRLEAMGDPSLVRGSGRSPNSGNFHLNEFEVSAVGTPVALQDVRVTFAEPMSKLPKIIDGKVDAACWGVWGQVGREHAALFSTAEGNVNSSELTFRLHCSRSGFKQHSLGCFRLSASDDAEAFERESHRLRAMAMYDPWAKLIEAYEYAGNQRAVDYLMRRHPEAAVAVGDAYAKDLQWLAAIAAYRTAVTKETADGALVAKLATAYSETEQWNAAEAVWKRVTELQPDQVLGDLKVAECMRETGRLDECVNTLEEAANRVPHAWEPCRDLAELYQSRQQWGKLRGTYRRILERNPSVAAYWGLAIESHWVLAEDTGETTLKESLEVLRHIEGQESDKEAVLATVRFLQGACCLLNNHRDEYERMCRKSFEEAKKSSNTHVWYLASVLNACAKQTAIGQEESMELARRTYEKEPLEHHKTALALCLIRAGKHDEALEHLNGNFINVLHARAIAHTHLGEPEAAQLARAAARKIMQETSVGLDSKWTPVVRMMARLLDREVEELIGSRSN